MSDEKTEEPTEHKLREARKQGQVARSQDINAVVVTAASLLALNSCFHWSADRLMGLLLRTDQLLALDGQALGAWVMTVIGMGALAVLPVLAAVVVAGTMAGLVQVGLQVSFEPLMPKFERLNPVEGFKKIVSIRSLMELSKTLLITTALVGAIWINRRDLLAKVMVLMGAAPLSSLEGVSDALASVTRMVLLIWACYAIGDWTLQRLLFIKDQRMSKDEIKREHKESEGDPLIKSRRREIALEIVNGEGSAPRGPAHATQVMVTNPTHLAVLVQYVPGSGAPRVCGLGADDVAATMRCQAIESGVLLVEDVPLARALYRRPLGEVIESEMHLPVAELLVWTEQIDAACPLE